MYRVLISFFFMSFFIVTILTPSVVTILDLDYDITIMIDITEEEEKESKESSKDKDVKILQSLDHNFYSFKDSLASNQGFYSNRYASNYIDLISPPPEYV